MQSGNSTFISAPGAAGIIDPESGESATTRIDGSGVAIVTDDRTRRLLEAILLELKEHTRILHAANPGIDIADDGFSRTSDI